MNLKKDISFYFGTVGNRTYEVLTLKLSVGPLGRREIFMDIALSDLVNKHMCETLKIPDRLTKSLILLDFFSCKDEAVKGSIILRKSLDKVSITGPKIGFLNKKWKC